MADKYYRLVCFVVDICADILREYFVKLAKNDIASIYTTVDSYLAFRRHDVDQLLKHKKIRGEQYDLLYPSHDTADESKWDVTLLVTLITEIFASCLKPVEIFAMKTEIRGIRNDLQHYPNTANMSDDDFDDYWGRLDAAIMSFANNVLDPRGVALLRDKVNNAKCNNLPNIGDCLRTWYEERIFQLENKLSEVESNTRKTNDTLRIVTVEKPGPSGDKDKRIKVADNVLARLQARFESTMNELSNDFTAPNEVTDIRTKLRECHHVVVTGSNNSRYLETALVAIKGMDYNYKRSVEMNAASDWIHIDPKDIDLVVCIYPFGTFSYDESKAKAMADIYNSMIQTTRGANGDKTLDIIIVTDLKVLEECKMYHDHGILEEVVKVFTDTSLTQPADLTTGCSIQAQCMSSSLFPLLPLSRNLGVMTRNFLMTYKISSGQVDKEILRKAKKKLKACKAIVLTGHKKCGKTSIAVALASSYESTQCILLKEPNDVNKIDFQNICLVIIDEFAGKYRYEKNDVYKWYTMFDHLYNAVIAGQMNVIITCEQSKLEKCINEIERHAILDHTVDVSTRTNIIKQEMVESRTGRIFLISTHEETKKNARHGWNTINRFGLDMSTGVRRFDYHHVINQNSKGDASDSLIDEEEVQENDVQIKVCFDRHQQQSLQQNMLPQQQQHQKQSWQQTQQLHMSQQQNLNQKQVMLQTQIRGMQQARNQNQQKMMYSVLQLGKQQHHVPNKSVHHPRPHPAEQHFHIQQMQNRPATVQHLSLLNSNIIPGEEESNQTPLQGQKQIEENNENLMSLGFQPQVRAQIISTQSDFNTQPHILSNCDLMGSIGAQSSLNQLNDLEDSGSRHMLTQTQGKPTEMREDFDFINSNSIVQGSREGVQSKKEIRVITVSCSDQSQVSSLQQKTQMKPSMQLPLKRGPTTSSLYQCPIYMQSMTSNNQAQSQSLVIPTTHMQVINTDNVVLEGGGQSEENHACKIRDRHGCARAMVWQNRGFNPYVKGNGVIKLQYPMQLKGELTGLKRGIQTQTGDSCAKKSRSLGPHVWSVKEYSLSDIEMEDDDVCLVKGSCILPSGEIILADMTKLKKLNSRYEVISMCNIHSYLFDVCYIGDNVAVVSSVYNGQLYFVDTRHDISLIRSISMGHDFYALACHGDRIYARDDDGSIHICSKDGIRQQILIPFLNLILA